MKRAVASCPTEMGCGFLAASPDCRRGVSASMEYNFRFGALLRYTDEIVEGVLLTLQLSAITMVLGLAIGLAVAVARTGPFRPVRVACRGLCRGHPQHAAAGPAVHRLLRLAEHRHQARRQRLRPWSPCRSISEPMRRDLPGRLRIDPTSADRGWAIARTDRGADLPPRRAVPRDQEHLPGACQPVRAAAAGHQRGVLDRRRPNCSTRPPSSTRAPTAPSRPTP